jgi:hypothetical protein
MYKNSLDVGYSPGDHKRFSVLDRLEFSSLLDVGSGPCILQCLLKDVEYEAVDVREDSLSHCNCKTHTTVPSRKKYDLVCFFGTFAYGNKEDVFSLLQKASKRAKKYVIFSVINPFPRSGKMLTYDESEILKMISIVSPKAHTLDTTTEPTETIVICEL